MVPSRILPLSAAPQCAGEVTDWLHAEWYAQGGETRAALAERLCGRARARFPITFVALRSTPVGEQAVGTFTLEGTQDPCTGLKRWCLSNLFVLPEWRGLGIGRHLCQAAADETRALRIPRLSLFTESGAGFYIGLGWRPVAVVPLETGAGPVWAWLMQRDVGSEPGMAPAAQQPPRARVRMLPADRLEPRRRDPRTTWAESPSACCPRPWQ